MAKLPPVSITTVRPQSDAHLGIQVDHLTGVAWITSDDGFYREGYSVAALQAFRLALGLVLALLGEEV